MKRCCSIKITAGNRNKPLDILNPQSLFLPPSLSLSLSLRLLDDIMSLRCDEYRRCYGNVLYRWGLLTQRSEVMKYQSSTGLIGQRKETSMTGY